MPKQPWPFHVIEFQRAGWTLMHPLACRPDLFDCPMNKAAEELAEPPAHEGRFVVDLEPAIGALRILREATATDLKLAGQANQTGLLYEDVRAQLLDEIRAEREAQIGHQVAQHLPDGTTSSLAWVATRARTRCAEAADAGTATWRHVLEEEVAKAMAEENPATLRTELMQVAAVCLAWVEDIDSRTAADTVAAADA